jgi:hypothetical protein
MKQCKICGKLYRFNRLCCGMMVVKLTSAQAKEAKKNHKAGVYDK